MIKYEVFENTREVSYKGIAPAYHQGITYEADEFTPTRIASFESLAEAEEELAKHESSVRKFDRYVEFTEYYVEENVYAEDGEWIDSRCVYSFSSLPEEA